MKFGKAEPRGVCPPHSRLDWGQSPIGFLKLATHALADLHLLLRALEKPPPVRVRRPVAVDKLLPQLLAHAVHDLPQLPHLAGIIGRKLARSVRHLAPIRRHIALCLGEFGGEAARVDAARAHEPAGLCEPGEHLVGAVREDVDEIAALEPLDDDGVADAYEDVVPIIKRTFCLIPLVKVGPE